jgi:hypothetical protein
MKLPVLSRRSSSAAFASNDPTVFPASRLARASRDQRQAEIFRQQLLFFHQNAARVHQKSDLGGKWIGDLFVGSDPGDRFSFDDPKIDFAGQLPDHLHFVHLRQLLQAVANLPQIYAENILAFAQPGRFQDLISLQRSVRLHFDLAELVIRIFEEEPFRSEPDSEENSDPDREHEHNLRNDYQHAAIAMLGSFMRTDPNIEEMLLAALPGIRNPFVSRPHALILQLHAFDPRLFSES